VLSPTAPGGGGRPAAARSVLAALAEGAPVPLIATDVDWRIVAANDAAARATGHDAAALVGLSFARLLTLAGRVIHQSKLARQLLESGRLDEVAIDLVRADGERTAVLMASRMIEDPALPGATCVTSLTPSVDRRAFERELLQVRKRVERSERHLVSLLRISRELAAARTIGDLESCLAEHLAAIGFAAPSIVREADARDADARAGAEAAADGRRTLVLESPEGRLGVLHVTEVRSRAAHVDAFDDTPIERELLLDALVTAAGQALGRVTLLERLRAQASTDGLTGLANRRRFDAVLAEVLDVRARRGGSVTLLYLDLDGFKEVNDRYGHEIGDRVLIDVAAILLREVRARDDVARLGGDEFAVLSTALPTAEDAGRVRSRIARALRQEVGELLVGASIGMVHLDDARGERVRGEDLLRAADGAMYREKARRRVGDAVVVDRRTLPATSRP
jgi:diguanylate cyclase (GGDEF)-like protein/PAS domain S-box-containing protein